MSKNTIYKVHDLITRYKRLEGEIINKHSHIKWLGSEVEEKDTVLYQITYYDSSHSEDAVSMADTKQVIEDFQYWLDLANTTTDYSDVYAVEYLCVPPHRLKGLDSSSCYLKVEHTTEPEPYEDYINDVVIISVVGCLPWTEEQRENEKVRLEEEIKGIETKMNEVKSELVVLGINFDE